MPLEELSRRRKEYLDAQVEYTVEDGTVAPLPYVKMRALIHSYGMGCGNTVIDSPFTELMNEVTPEQAQAFVDMPWGEKFTALDLFAKGGRTLDECREACEYLADTGYLARFETNAGAMYHQVPYFTGTYEYHQRRTIETGGTFVHPIVGADLTPNDMATTGTPVYYSIPCDASVVADGGIMLYDDVQQIIEGRNRFAIATCYCRYQALVRSLEEQGIHDYPSFEDFNSGAYEDYMSPVDGHRVETCLLMGDEAEYWAGLGVARWITKKDARRYMERSRDDGFILQCIKQQGHREHLLVPRRLLRHHRHVTRPRRQRGGRVLQGFRPAEPLHAGSWLRLMSALRHVRRALPAARHRDGRGARRRAGLPARRRHVLPLRPVRLHLPRPGAQARSPACRRDS